MALLVGQLLFAERVDDDKVHIDVIVLERPELDESPPIGAPLCFEFALPGDETWHDTMAGMLQSWAQSLAVVELNLLHRNGRTLVQVASGRSTLLLEEPAV